MPLGNSEENIFFNSLNLDLTADHFDFRELTVKRKEFNSKRNQLLKKLVEERGSICQLKLLEQCEGKIVIDHMIPLSSNILNKRIHKVTSAQGRKVISKSFGSNHPQNLLLACEKCNNYKKHRFIQKTQDEKFIIVMM